MTKDFLAEAQKISTDLEGHARYLAENAESFLSEKD